MTQTVSCCLQKVNEYLLKAIKITFDGMTCIETYFCLKRDIKTNNYVISDLCNFCLKKCVTPFLLNLRWGEPVKLEYSACFYASNISIGECLASTAH